MYMYIIESERVQDLSNTTLVIYGLHFIWQLANSSHILFLDLYIAIVSWQLASKKLSESSVSMCQQVWTEPIADCTAALTLHVQQV